MKLQIVPPEEAQRYRVQRRLEINQALNRLVDSRAMLSLIAGRAESPTALSALLRVHKDRIWLDPSRDERFNQILLAADGVQAVTSLERVLIQFHCRHLRTEAGGDFGTVLAADFPDELIRLQRRENYRLETSLIHPVKCLIHKENRLMETTVVDISVGGVGVLAYRELGQLNAGEVYHGCRLALPGSGEFAVSLEVRSIYDVQRRDRRDAHRAGCQFIDLPTSIETQIQRYIIRVDRERRARFT